MLPTPLTNDDICMACFACWQAAAHWRRQGEDAGARAHYERYYGAAAKLAAMLPEKIDLTRVLP